MMNFTYSIFDADPDVSGSAWPSHDDVEIYAEDEDEAIADAVEVAELEGSACGAYETGDRLWVLVWDADDINIAKRVVIVETAEPGGEQAWISEITSGTLTSTANQVVAYNSAGVLTLQGLTKRVT